MKEKIIAIGAISICGLWIGLCGYATGRIVEYNRNLKSWKDFEDELQKMKDDLLKDFE